MAGNDTQAQAMYALTGVKGAFNDVERAFWDLMRTNPPTKGEKGDTGAAGTPGAPGASGTILQRIRTQASTTTPFTWTFPTPYPDGTFPVIQVTVEGDATSVYNHKVTNLTSTSVTVSITRSTVSVVSLIGLSVLSVPAGSATAFLHLSAASQT